MASIRKLRPKANRATAREMVFPAPALLSPVIQKQPAASWQAHWNGQLAAAHAAEGRHGDLAAGFIAASERLNVDPLEEIALVVDAVRTRLPRRAEQ